MRAPEATGGRIDLDKLPVGDPTLSDKEIVGNESQERMGLVMDEKHIGKLRAISERERAPMYVIGETTGDMQFTFVDNRTGEKPIDLQLNAMFGEAPRTVMTDHTVIDAYRAPEYDVNKVGEYLTDVLQLEGVACKDWLTNKVDRSVTGRVAMQQTAGTLQLPLNDCAVIALDYQGNEGIATALGHAPAAAMADPAKGSVLAIAEALTNIVFAPLKGSLEAVSLSANWMWPCKNEGEDARLYRAVQAASDFAIDLKINIPTGKDSLSMTQKYPDGKAVLAPGTVIITSAGEVSDVKKCVRAALDENYCATADTNGSGSSLIYVDMTGGEDFLLGGSAFAQIINAVGSSADVPTVKDAGYFAKAFNAVQHLIEQGHVLAGHDISGGGLITALLEMAFGGNKAGLDVDLNPLRNDDLVKLLFSEKPAVLLQVASDKLDAALSSLDRGGVAGQVIAKVNGTRKFTLRHGCCEKLTLDIDKMRDVWYKTSYLLDRNQSTPQLALERYENYKKQPLYYDFPASFSGKLSQYGIDPKRKTRTGIRAAIIREKGCQCDRETAWAMHLAGFDVKDVHMTDLISGRETLEDVNLIAFVGGFSNSDVLGSAKGWAGAFLYNPKAKEALDRFYARPDTLSIGICNGCQLMVELGLIAPKTDEDKPKMQHNDSHKLESRFLGVTIQPSPSVMLRSLENSILGVWITHAEGKFHLPYAEEHYHIPMKFLYASYPANPNGSDYNAAAICSADGRHLAMMPHLERSIRPWSWGYYSSEAPRSEDEITPWIEAFVNAREWIKGHTR